MAKVRKTDTCWLWEGGVVRGRYGQFRPGTRSTDPHVYAHRWLYERMVGPVPEGLELDHVKERCSSTLCVNPTHLEPVTHAENMRRARKEVCVNGHDLTVPRNMAWDKLGRRRGCAQCNRDRVNARYRAQKEG
jgi:hypothetical protein